MQRVDTSTAAQALPAQNGAGAPGYFTQGNPQTGVPATVPGQDWFNAVQEELAYVVTQAGIALNKADNTQLRQAIQKMIQSSAQAIVISAAVFAAGVAAGNAVRWDAANNRFDKATADGTANDEAVGFADVANSKVYCYGETPALFAGLTAGVRYYLDPATAGAITTNAPSDVALVGIAMSATTMFVDIDYKGTTASTASIVADSRNLIIKNNAANPNYQIDITADEIVLKDASGNAYLATNVAHTIDITVSGINGKGSAAAEAPNTDYYVWEWAKADGTKGATLDVSGTAPTVPNGGYVYKALVGVRYNDASSNFRRQWQEGRRIKQAEVVVFNLLTGTTAWTSQSVSVAVPPIAKSVSGTLGCSSATNLNLRMLIAGDANGVGTAQTTHAGLSPSWNGFYNSGSFSDVPLITPQTVFCLMEDTSASYRLNVSGFTI